MNNKVKEIKNWLYERSDGKLLDNSYNLVGITYGDILTLINELESENERLILQYERVKADSEMNCLEHKDRIAGLENTIKNNLQYTKGYGDGVKATVEVAYPKKLNEFTERLIEKAKKGSYIDKRSHANLTDFIIDIDETLKEFINE